MDSDSPRSTVRRYVRAERERRGWSQSELAEAAGVSRGTIANLERGMHLTEGKEAKIEAALGKTVGWLDGVRSGHISEAVEFRATTEEPPTSIDPPPATLADLQREYVHFMQLLGPSDMERLYRLCEMYHQLQLRIADSTEGGERSHA